VERADDLKRVDDKTFEVDGVVFVSDWTAGASRADRFSVMKDPPLIEQYVELLRDHPSELVVELGVREGGSTALLALLGKVTRLVAFELTPSPAPALIDLIERHGLSERIRPYFGVDQADRERLRAVVDDEFGDQRLDLVIDDASHRLRPTRASFETLFPRLAPGGLYVIEDWSWEHRAHAALDDPTSEGAEAFNQAIVEAMKNPTPEEEALFATWLRVALRQRDDERLALVDAPAEPPERPLMDMLVQLLFAVAVDGETVADIRIDPEWITITRGPAELDPTTFRLTDLVPDFDRLLASD
jgi:predicted O-methyltransferase YrrM